MGALGPQEVSSSHVVTLGAYTGQGNPAEALTGNSVQNQQRETFVIMAQVGANSATVFA